MFEPYLTNQIYKTQNFYCGIVGLNPSQGARSPILWNSVFRKKKIPVEFLPFDISSHTKLKAFLGALKKDLFFLGGSVAIPYKETIVSYLDELHPSALSGAVNCIYRTHDQKLVGMNTDGLAAVQSLKRHSDFQSLLLIHPKLRILIWGAGGVAKAISVSLLKDVELNVSEIVVVFRSEKRKESWKFLLQSDKLFLKRCEDISKEMTKYDIIIQCTPVGSQLSQLEEKSPFENIKMLDVLTHDFSIFFDVNYAPSESLSMKGWKNLRSTKPLNGLEMNRLQAAIAFEKVLSSVNWVQREEVSLQEISKIMEKGFGPKV